MIPNEFVYSFNNFFRLGTEPFFKNTYGNFSWNNNFSNIRTSNCTSFEENGRNNNTPVVINNRRLQWYDSNLQRALAPLPTSSARSVYLTRSELEQLPTKIFDETKVNEYDITDCDICLGVFKNGSQIKVLPCKHSYHHGCIDKWLMQQPMCPRCRAGVRSGLRKQYVKNNNGKLKNKNDNALLAESVEKRRKLFNDYYLKKRKKRLEKLAEEMIITDLNNKCDLTKSVIKIKEKTENTNIIENIKVDLLPEKNLPQTFNSKQSDDSPRIKAVEAALKRLELTKQDKESH